MKTVKAGSRLSLTDGLYELAPGVKGYAIRKGQSVYIPFLAAVTPGAGDVARFLDSLPGEFKEAKIPNVISSRLVGMLQRHGFRRTVEPVPGWGEHVEVWVKP